MIPAFGIKQDAIPGFVRDNWFRAEITGDFYGQCAELCGKEHAYMPIHVKVLSAQDYSKWVEGRDDKKSPPRPMTPAKSGTSMTWPKRGEKVYAANCAACHQANGKGAGPHQAFGRSAVVLDADKPSKSLCCSDGQAGGGHACLEGNCRTPIWLPSSATPKTTGLNKTGQIVAACRRAGRSQVSQSRKFTNRGSQDECRSRPSRSRSRRPHGHAPAGWRRWVFATNHQRQSVRCTSCSALHAHRGRLSVP